MRCAFSTMNLTARTYHKVLKSPERSLIWTGKNRLGAAIWKRRLDTVCWIKNTGGGNVGDLWILVCQDENISDNKKKKLREAYGSAKEIYYIEETQLRLQNFLTKKDIEQLKMARKQKDLEEKYYNMEEKGIDFVPYFQKTYPKRLSELDGAPYALYVKGKLPEEDRPSVAIIGARRCSNYGEVQALEYGKCLASAGYRLSVVLHLVLTGRTTGCTKWRRNNLWRVRLRSGHLLSERKYRSVYGYSERRRDNFGANTRRTTYVISFSTEKSYHQWIGRCSACDGKRKEKADLWLPQIWHWNRGGTYMLFQGLSQVLSVRGATADQTSAGILISPEEFLKELQNWGFRKLYRNY